MAEWTIYFNPKCGSCRKTLDLLHEKKIKPRVVTYLRNPPSVKELDALLRKLRVAPTDIIRTKEPIYDELNLETNAKSREDVLRAISEHPVLLQRPIVACDDRAVIARPPEKVLDLF